MRFICWLPFSFQTMLHTTTFVIKSAIDGTSIVNALFGYFLIYFPLVQTMTALFSDFSFDIQKRIHIKSWHIGIQTCFQNSNSILKGYNRFAIILVIWELKVNLCMSKPWQAIVVPVWFDTHIIYMTDQFIFSKTLMTHKGRSIHITYNNFLAIVRQQILCRKRAENP